MNKIIKWLTSIPSDKLLHFIVSGILYALFFKMLILAFGLYNLVPYILAGVLTFGIGILKEYLDQKDGGKFDFLDLLADLLGIAICWVILIL